VTTDLAAAVAAFDDETRDHLAQALWLDELDLAAIPPDAAARLADPKNSPRAHGDRMRRFLRYLIDHPVSHTPDHRDVYERLFDRIGDLSPHQAYVIQAGFLGAPAAVGYDMIPVPAGLEFPRDHLPKPRSQVGWHFFVGSCWATDGTEYGVELMFFQTAMYPPAIAAWFGLSDDENQTVELQLAVSEAGGHHYQAIPVVLAGTSGLVGYRSDPFEYRLGRNSIRCHRSDGMFPVTIQARGVDRGSDPQRTLAVDLTFTSGKETLLQGAGGCMPSVDGMGSLYYSIPAMRLDPAVSALRLDGRSIALERGIFWFDHQWGAINGVPASPVMRAAQGSAEASPGGWDWFMAQFDGDRQLTVFAPHGVARKAFYHQAGEVPPGTMSVEVAGTYMDPDRQTRIIRGTLDIGEWIRAVRSPDPSRYLVTDTWYPNGWAFRFGDDVPEDIRSFTMTPIVREAQSGFFANSAQYAEGAVILRDQGGTEVGRGFAESVAYADTRRTAHRLAGLDESDESIEALRSPELSIADRLANAVYVAAHKADLEEVVKASAGLEFFVRT
jgi:predicted secreted hydrolase